MHKFFTRIGFPLKSSNEIKRNDTELKAGPLLFISKLHLISPSTAATNRISDVFLDSFPKFPLKILDLSNLRALIPLLDPGISGPFSMLTPVEH